MRVQAVGKPSEPLGGEVLMGLRKDLLLHPAPLWIDAGGFGTDSSDTRSTRSGRSGRSSTIGEDPETQRGKRALKSNRYRDFINSESSASPIEEVPLVFSSWEAYINCFRVPVLEDCRAQIASQAGLYAQQQPRFRLLDVVQWGRDKSKSDLARAALVEDDFYSFPLDIPEDEDPITNPAISVPQTDYSYVILKCRPKELKPGDVILISELDISDPEISERLFMESGADRSSIHFNFNSRNKSSTSIISSSNDIPANPLVDNVGVLMVLNVKSNHYDKKRKKTHEAVAHCTVHHFPTPHSGPPQKLYVSETLGTVIPLNRIYMSLTRPGHKHLPTPNLNAAILEGKFPYARKIADASITGVPVGGLNRSQQKAHDAALATCKESGVCLIQGPPGTGKTKTVATIMCSILERMQTKILQCAPTNTAMCQVASRLVQERRTQLGPDNFDPCEVIILGHRDKMMELLADSDRQFSMELRIEMVARCVDTLVKALEAALVVSQNRNGGGGGGVGRGGTGAGNGKRGGKKGGLAESNHSATMATQKSVQMVYDAVKVYCKEMKLLVGEKLFRLDLQLIPPFDSITRFVDIVVALRGPDGAGDKGGTGKTPMGIDVRGDGTKSSQQTVLEAAERLPQQVRPFIMFDKNECLDQGTMERRNVTTGLQGLFLMKARSIFSTLNGTFSNHLRDEIAFNIVIVDEAAQATEAETTCIMRECVKTVILVGDPKQLESTVMSADCEKAKFGRSLMERLLTLKHPFYLLETQYRMHPRIAQFSSKNFYDGWLMDSDHVQAYDPPWYKTPQFSAVQFVAHTGTMHSRDNGGSSINELEANLICRRIQSFLTATSSHSTNLSIGIICPYKAQKHLLESLIKTTFRPRQQKQISVNTVDGFQGQERDVIILSLTRVGYVSDFLDDLKRVNVALTRAKFNLWVFGDHKTYNRCLGQFGSFGWFYSHCETLGFVKFVNVSKAEQTQYQQIQQVERNGSENGNSSGVEDDEEEEEEVVGMAEEDEEEEEEDIEDQQHGKFGIVAVEVPMRQAKRFQPGGRGGHNQKLMATLSVGTLESTEASLLDAWDSAFD